MKSKILSFLSALTCLCFLVSPLCCGAELGVELIELLEETVFSELIARSKEAYDSTDNRYKLGYVGLGQAIQDKMMESAFGYPIIENGELKYKIGNYDLITGKMQLHYTTGTYNGLAELTDTATDDILLECTIVATDFDFGVYNDRATDTAYFANGLNFTITRSNGSVKHYFVEFPSSWKYSSAVTVSSSGSVTVQGNTSCTLYEVNGFVRNAVQTNFSCSACTFTSNPTNSITVDLNSLQNPPSQSGSTFYTTYPVGFYSSLGTPVSSSGALPYPVDIDLLHGSFLVKYLGYNGSGLTGGSSGPAFNVHSRFYTSFYTTNAPNHITATSQWTEPYQKNYYVTNNNYKGGTIINNQNYMDYGNGGLAPAFELDTSLPNVLDLLGDLFPSLLDAVLPDITGNITDLLGDLLDFFGHMPDIGAEWQPEIELNPNDYWDVELPALPDEGGGGSGGDITVNVTVDITRPLVTTYTYDDPIEIETLPIITTYTMPAEITERTSDILSNTTSFLNNTGLIPIYAFLTLIGIGVAIIFKGV